MKRVRKYIIVIVFIIGMFLNIQGVNAKVNLNEISESDQYVYCVYDYINYYYNSTKGDFIIEKGSISFTTIDTDLVEANFVSNSDNELFCPVIYKELSGSGRSAHIKYSSTQKSGATSIQHDEDASKINNPSNIPETDFKTCKYSNYVFQLNVSQKNIVKIYDATGEFSNVQSDAKFDDIYSDDKCQCVNFKIVTNKREYVVANLQINQGDTKICPSSSGSTGQVEPSKPDDNNDTEAQVCDVIPEDIKNYIMQALKLIRWIGLVLLIVLGALDFVKAAASDDQDAMKKASQNFIKRLIAVIILFLLPMLVELILFIIGKLGFNFGECYNISEF